MLRNVVVVLGLALFATACASVPATEGAKQEAAKQEVAKESKKKGKNCKKVRGTNSRISERVCS